MRHQRGAEPRPTPSEHPRTVALRLLGRRDYTTAELSAKLLDRGYDRDTIAVVIAGLTADAFLDDRRVALAHARTASRVKGRGHLRIRRELEARGVSRALVQEATQEISPDEQFQALTRLVARKRGGAALDPAARRRLFAQLLRRGFPADLVAKALAWEPDDEES